ncbi:ATP-binding protein [Phormidium sp. CLA17]|uniref:ATP-binding protein n=1 Tax=Leptolyngbya sp. Cla-17 TaxID=2803751 RepID=UPI0014916AA2|nr:ATP-binding protein [Leptolyngbya sp. Cla-17]MBM0740246.1 ATP-binding protein [Leptolyngbya sp. Cla-17]
MSSDSNNLINASPTKEFFIYMLVKDLDLTRAISDLIDNCIDGAKRLRGIGSYEGLAIEIDANENLFRISDNCGGIPIDIARTYAFRFGRVSGTPMTDYSIGRFGVGMKRAIFKLGKFFGIESITNSSRFVVEQDVEQWAQEVDNWDFRFKEVDPNYSLNEISSVGTTITVTQLYEGISEELSLVNYQTRLRNELTEDHQISIERGLKIVLNGIPLKPLPIKILQSPHIAPAYKQLSRDGGIVSVRLYTGITKPLDPKDTRLDPSKAGWNIFCNERLVLGADKSPVTGWGRENGNPGFHNDHARFIGFAFFESTQPDLLPWNTTKSGIDSDLSSYRAVKEEMTKMMKPVIKFLGNLSKEKRNQEEGDESLTPLEKLINSAQLVPLTHISSESNFTVIPPESTDTDRIKMRNIQYSKSEEEILKVQKALGGNPTLGEVGVKTFEYYMMMECEEE